MNESNKENITPSKSNPNSFSTQNENDNPLNGYTTEEIKEQFSSLFNRFDKQIEEAQTEKERLRNDIMHHDYNISKDLCEVNLIKDILFKKELKVRNFERRVKSSKKGFEKEIIDMIYKIDIQDKFNFTLTLEDIKYKYKRDIISGNYSLINISSENNELKSQFEIEDNSEDVVLFSHRYLN